MTTAVDVPHLTEEPAARAYAAWFATLGRLFGLACHNYPDGATGILLRLRPELARSLDAADAVAEEASQAFTEGRGTWEGFADALARWEEVQRKAITFLSTFVQPPTGPQP